MGLIKTAILTGGGIYAVNKLSKTAEKRYDSRAQSRAQPPSQYDQRAYERQQDYRYQNQGDPSHYQTREIQGDDRNQMHKSPQQFDDYRDDWNRDPNVYSYGRDQPPTYGQNETPRRSSPPWESQGPQYQSGGYAPPIPSRQRERGFITEDDDQLYGQDQPRQQRSGGLMDDLVGIVGQVGGGRRSNKNRDDNAQGLGSGKAAQMLSGFFKD